MTCTCGKEISWEEWKCPHCNRATWRTMTLKAGIFGTVFITLPILLMFAMCG